MPIIMLFMQRKAIAQSLINKLCNNKDVRLMHETDYTLANEAIYNNNCKCALIESAESGKYNMSYCLNLCSQIKKTTPNCKLLLMCSEHDEEGIKLVVKAKGDNQIDDFVFYDATIDYLASKLLSI